MDKIQIIYLELGAIFNSPKLYLMEQFDFIRNQIDSECEKFRFAVGKFMNKDFEEFVQQRQTEIREEIDLFQKQCFSNLTSNPIGQMNLRAIEHCVKNLNHEDTDAVSEFHKKLYRELHMRKKALFLSKGMVFLGRECCAHVFNYRDDNVLESLARDGFGSLFIIEDEFLIYSDKFQELTNNTLEEDFCNEGLRIRFLLIEYRNQTKTKTNTMCRAVNRIKLNLNHQKEFIDGNAADNWQLSPTNFTRSEKFLEDWLVDLPALTSVTLCVKHDLVELEPTVFRNAANLKQLTLSSNHIRSLDSQLFSFSKHLQVLDISNNEITELNEEIFMGLTSLTYLNISLNYVRDLPQNLFKDLVNLEFLCLRNNRLRTIPKGLFRSLATLKHLDLGENEINLSDQSEHIFQGLDQLQNLFLHCNQIKEIPEGLFRNLVHLKGIDLSGHQLTFFPEGFFSGLTRFKFLQLNEGDNKDLLKSIPLNIHISEDVYQDLEEDEDKE